MSEPTLRTRLSSGPWKERARWAARIVTPWGLEWWLWKRFIEREQRRIEASRVCDAPGESTRVEECIRFLVARGLDEFEVREGSMPAASLHYLADRATGRLPSDRPLRALHVGNFVGVSLCYISWLVKERHPESLVVSIDPNVPHRGVEDPQSHAVALLDHFQQLGRNLIITGYTLERGEQPTNEAELRSFACEDVLPSLCDLAGGSFDLVLLDGNHEEGYLRRELAAVTRLMADHGILALDDVGDWPGVAAAFSEAAVDDSFTELGDDGRVGILELHRH